MVRSLNNSRQAGAAIIIAGSDHTVTVAYIKIGQAIAVYTPDRHTKTADPWAGRQSQNRFSSHCAF